MVDLQFLNSSVGSVDVFQNDPLKEISRGALRQIVG